jgi:hypothetical protein
MRALSNPRLLLLAAATLAVSAGCSGSAGTTLAPAPLAAKVPQVRSEKSTGPFQFISDWNNHAVYIIDRQGNTTTLPVDSPDGLAVDASRALYVVNGAGSNVLVYAPPYTGNPKILSDAGAEPVGVAVDRDGNVAVTSVGSPSAGPGGIVFYAKGATSPTKTIQANGRFAGDYYCAFDAHGNLFLDSKNGSGPFEAGEVAGGIAGNSVTPLTTRNLLTYPAGIAVTKSGKIAILDQSDGTAPATIYTYDPPKRGSLGNPVATTTLASANNAVAFAFQGARGDSVLTADTFTTLGRRNGPDHGDQIGQTQLFKYPAGGAAMESVRLPYNAILVGVAVR